MALHCPLLVSVYVVQAQPVWNTRWKYCTRNRVITWLKWFASAKNMSKFGQSWMIWYPRIQTLNCPGIWSRRFFEAIVQRLTFRVAQFTNSWLSYILKQKWVFPSQGRNFLWHPLSNTDMANCLFLSKCMQFHNCVTSSYQPRQFGISAIAVSNHLLDLPLWSRMTKMLALCRPLSKVFGPISSIRFCKLLYCA